MKFEAGDRVKIVKKIDSKEHQVYGYWNSVEMDKYIGCIGKVQSNVYGRGFVPVSVNGGYSFVYPQESLELVDKQLLLFE